jgi:hypothetical protein
MIFGACVIVGVGLLGVLSHLIVYLTSQKLQNRLFAITAIAQVTFGMYRVSHRSNLKWIIIGLNFWDVQGESPFQSEVDYHRSE